MTRLASILLFLSLLCVLWVFVVSSPAAEPCRSGLQPGQRPGPYAAVICTGPERGRSHCYVCETGDRPVVIIFARTLSGPLGKLAQQLDRALGQYKAAQLRGWITFLNEDQAAFDPKVVAWGQKYALRHLPLGVFEDKDGPPSYRLSPEADVTVLLSVRQRVVANFAFRAGEMNEAAIAEVLRALPTILASKGSPAGDLTSPHP
jgi:hypothetical protein